LLVRLGDDQTARHGRSFSWRNLFSMRNFYPGWEILPTPSAEFEARVILRAEGAGASEPFGQTVSDNFQLVPARAPLAEGNAAFLAPVSFCLFLLRKSTLQGRIAPPSPGRGAAPLPPSRW
jgi:hypothetical protein